MSRAIPRPAVPPAPWLLAGALLAGLLHATAARAEEPSRITTDTADYCRQLTDELDAEPDVPDMSRRLGEEGRALCEAGHIRAGIFRARRAWVILHQNATPVVPLAGPNSSR